MKAVKMHGYGNDFVIFDLREINDFDDKKKTILQNYNLITNRKFGIGCDQFVIILPSNNLNTHQAEVLFFNSDGTESGACGNATRCVASLIGGQKITLKTKGGMLHTNLIGNRVEVNMGKPRREADLIPVAKSVNFAEDEIFKIYNNTLRSFFVNDPIQLSLKQVFAVGFGNPHCVLDIEVKHNFGEGDVNIINFIKSNKIATDMQMDFAISVAKQMPKINLFLGYKKLNENNSVNVFCNNLGALLSECLERQVKIIGEIIENSTEIFTQKTNVEFVEKINEREIFFKVWERGSGITLACGTGACAAGYYCIANNITTNPVKVYMDGCIEQQKIQQSDKPEFVQISFNTIGEIIMNGGFAHVCQIEIDMQPNNLALNS